MILRGETLDILGGSGEDNSSSEAALVRRDMCRRTPTANTANDKMAGRAVAPARIYERSRADELPESSGRPVDIGEPRTRMPKRNRKSSRR